MSFSMLATQAEYRFPLGGRFGGVVFGGWGKVAPSFGEVDDQPDLPSTSRSLSRGGMGPWSNALCGGRLLGLADRDDNGKALLNSRDRP
jgi:hypothetical protein